MLLNLESMRDAIIELMDRVESLEARLEEQDQVIEQLRYEGPRHVALAEDDYDDLIAEEFDW